MLGRHHKIGILNVVLVHSRDWSSRYSESKIIFSGHVNPKILEGNLNQIYIPHTLSCVQRNQVICVITHFDHLEGQDVYTTPIRNQIKMKPNVWKPKLPTARWLFTTDTQVVMGWCTWKKLINLTIFFSWPKTGKQETKRFSRITGSKMTEMATGEV